MFDQKNTIPLILNSTNILDQVQLLRKLLAFFFLIFPNPVFLKDKQRSIQWLQFDFFSILIVVYLKTLAFFRHDHISTTFDFIFLCIGLWEWQIYWFINWTISNHSLTSNHKNNLIGNYKITYICSKFVLVSVQLELFYSAVV